MCPLLGSKHGLGSGQELGLPSASLEGTRLTKSGQELTPMLPGHCLALVT